MPGSGESVTRAREWTVVVRDQGRLRENDGIVSLETDSWSQSITTGIAGKLRAIEILVDEFSRPAPPTIDFDFSIFDGGNPPTGSALFSEQVTATDIVGATVVRWDVSSANRFFNVDDVFTFAVSAQQDGVDISGDYDASGLGYPDGGLFKNGSALSIEISDMAFITYVEPVPEPETLLLFVSAVLTLGLVARRRRKVTA
jgi:hypothetical protein